MMKTNFNFIENLTGLSRANFISELNKKSFDYIKDIKPSISEIVKILCKKKDLMDYEKREIARLVILFEVELGEEQIDVIIQEVLEVVKYTKNLRISSVVMRNLCKKVASISDTDTFLYAFHKILLNSIILSEKKIIIDSISSRLIELTNFSSIVDKIQLYSIVCFTTYFNGYDISKIIWSKLINSVNSDGKIDYKLCSFIQYNAHLAKEELNPGIVQFIIDSLKTGLLKSKGTTEIELLFISDLMLLLADDENKIRIKNYDELKKAINDYSDSNNLEYFKWCIDGAQPYPSAKWNYHNILYNQRVVLYKEGKLLIRGKAKIFTELGSPTEEKVAFGTEKMHYFLYEIKGKKLSNFLDKLNEKDNLFEALRFLVIEYNTAQKNGEIYNVFEKGSYIESQDTKLLLYSKYDLYLVNEDTYVENNLANFAKMLLNEFVKSSSEIRLGSVSLLAKDFVNEFIPSLIRDTENKVFLIGKLVEAINNYAVNSIYDLETCKIIALIEYVKYRKKTTLDTSVWYNEFDSLILYLNLFSDQDRAEKSLFFARNNAFSSSNLFEFTESIKFSLKSNLNDLFIDKFANVFEKSEERVFERNAGLELKDYILAKVEVIHADENHIIINEKKCALSNLKYMIFGEKDKDLSQVQQSDISKLTSSTIFYSNYQIVIIPDWMIRVKDICKNKEGVNDISQFKNISILENDPSFGKAVNTVAFQNDIEIKEAKQRIFRYFNNINTKYYSVLLEILGSYKVISNQELDAFVSKIKCAYDNSSDLSIVMPLKDTADDNGLMQIFKKRSNEQFFDRNTKYDKYNKNLVKTVNEHNAKTSQLTIVTDIGISGSQFCNAISFYLQTISKECKQKYWAFEDGSFPKLFSNISTLTILCCYYTETFETKIRTYFKNDCYRHIEIIFDGEKIVEENYLFINCIGKTNLISLKEYLQSRKDLLSKKLFTSVKTFQDYIDELEKTIPNNLLLARYRSMPKAHLINFTFDKLLKYRVDK